MTDESGESDEAFSFGTDHLSSSGLDKSIFSGFFITSCLILTVCLASFSYPVPAVLAATLVSCSRLLFLFLQPFNRVATADQLLNHSLSIPAVGGYLKSQILAFCF